MPDPHPLVCRFGAFGDMVMLIPMLNHLYARSGLPCDVVAIGAWNRHLFQHMPCVRNVYTIDSRSRYYWIDAGQKALVKTLTEMQHQHVWVCETNKKSYQLLKRAGITRDNSITQLDQPSVAEEHYCNKWIRLAKDSPADFAGKPVETTSIFPQLTVTPEEIEACKHWLVESGVDSEAPIICIQAGSKRTTRQGKASRESNTKYWEAENWASVIDNIISHFPQAQVMLCGVPNEAEMCAEIKAMCQFKASVHSVANDLPMRRLFALLSLSHSCISVDTGPAHAAAALDCPLVVLFGQANPNRFRPISDSSPVSILIGKSVDDEDATADIGLITPEQVTESWLRLPYARTDDNFHSEA
ncbi:MAG: glycosyltransferase family 9 protein [Pseudomonadota bacterium]